ncbi:cyclophilin-like fold protein [Tolumonas auensis]|uniref:cyclophilin-like fold protein n=1 Tax=Tolumonas auensis TaxID=43948 RepID=UPI0002DA068C|nr:cyclophilin-like fold protein [Tolumonas auensis]
MNIRISIGSTIMVATLEDNPTARDFATLLPLTVTLRDFSAAEKVSGALPKHLSEDGAPATDAGAVGDIAYYAPWGNIAFYRGRGPDASGVIKIAKIISGIEALNQQGNVRATISRND